ncbi:hypothetical protein EIK77_007972 [Talaromyces pinophilus]|nr:hypothetical protein EIK77_007972 [Talaromyces pinophilus]
MDPVSVISLASSIAGLIDITSRSIVALLSLKSRYSRFGLKISQIAGQLSTLKAALKKIKDLIEVSHDNIHRKGERHIFALDDEQLVLDLALSIDCCESIIKVLDEQLSRFQLTSPSQSSGLNNVRTKARFLWEEGDLDDYQGMLNHQINALNLLLTVTRCESSMEQRNLLRRESSRQVFEQVKDDTSSLLLQRDKNSFLSRQSSAIDDIDFIDTEFGFERDLFSSKAYRSVARSWMRQSILSRENQNSSTIITSAAPQVKKSDSVISDTSTPVMPYDEKPSIITHTTVTLGYSPIPKIPVHLSKTSDLKISLKVPKLDIKRLQTSSPRLSAYARFSRRAALPPSVQPAATITETTTSKTKFLLLGTSASGKSTAMKAILQVQSRFHEYPSPTRLESIERLVCMIEEDVMDEIFKPESRSEEIEALREHCEKVRESLRKAETEPSLIITDIPLIREQLMELLALVETRGLVHKLPLSVLEEGDY